MLKYIRNFLVISALTISSAFAIGDKFDQPTFDRLLAEGAPVLVAVHADWCATCRAQESFLKDMLNTPPYNKLHVLRVDFDKQKDVVRFFNVRWQSTLIVFKKGKEVDRSTADTDKESVARLLREAL